MENNFNKIKEAALAILATKNPCHEQLRRVRNAQTEEDLLQVAKDNLDWCSENGACPDDILKMFTPEKLLAAGIANTGEGNTGLANTGDRNTGDSNTGSWNTGYRNTGYSNTGDRNTGAFCTGSAPFPIFNQPSNWTEQQFKDSKAFSLLCQVDTKQWVPSSYMTEEEKAKYPSHTTCEGYLKDIPFKEAFQNAWHNWSESNRKAFYELPNFTWEIFTEITGVKPE